MTIFQQIVVKCNLVFNTNDNIPTNSCKILPYIILMTIFQQIVVKSYLIFNTNDNIPTNSCKIRLYI